MAANQIDPKILNFLQKHNICSLTTLLLDGSPHAAALHYSHQEDPLTLFFSTENSSKKCQALLEGNIGKASVAIGFSEEEWITLQMDGEIKIIADKGILEKIYQIHYSKHPNSRKYKDDPNTIFLAFTPTWTRYTDFNTHPPTIISSQG